MPAYEASPLRAVTFDLDGLMFNTEELYRDVGAELLRRRGHAVTDELLDQMMGRPSQVALQIMIDRHELSATVAELQRETAEIFPALLESRLAPMPGLLDLLDALERHDIPAAVATSSRGAYVTQVLGQFELDARLRFVLTSDDVTHGKPAPDVYLLAARRHGVTPREMLVLEDSEVGCRAAVSAGAFAVAVPGAHSRQHRFEGAQLIADSLADERIYQALDLRKPAQP